MNQLCVFSVVFYIISLEYLYESWSEIFCIITVKMGLFIFQEEKFPSFYEQREEVLHCEWYINILYVFHHDDYTETEISLGLKTLVFIFLILFLTYHECPAEKKLALKIQIDTTGYLLEWTRILIKQKEEVS